MIQRRSIDEEQRAYQGNDLTKLSHPDGYNLLKKAVACLTLQICILAPETFYFWDTLDMRGTPKIFPAMMSRKESIISTYAIGAKLDSAPRGAGEQMVCAAAAQCLYHLVTLILSHFRCRDHVSRAW